MSTLEYLFTGNALFAAIAFGYAAVLGIVGIAKMVGQRTFRVLIGLGIVLFGVAWWHAAEQSVAFKKQDIISQETNQIVKQIAKGQGIDREASTNELAREVLEKLRGRMSALESRNVATVSFSDPHWIKIEGGEQLAVSLMKINYSGVKSGIVIGVTGQDVMHVIR